MKKYFFGGGLVILLLSAALFLVLTGRYPAVVVNGSVVWARQWRREYQAALTYYSRISGAYKKKQISRADLEADQANLKIAALNNLIKNQLLKEGLEALRGKEGERQVQKKVGAYTKNPDLKEAAKLLFGLNMENFTAMVLLPRARRELIKESLKKENRDFDHWLDSRAKEARIYVLAGGLDWDKGKLRKK